MREIFRRDPWLDIDENPPRKSDCQAKALAWILERQEQDGSWGGVFTQSLFCLLALASTGNPAYAEIIEKGLDNVLALQDENALDLNQKISRSPVMDTAYVLDVLLSAGVAADQPAIRLAVSWLLGKAITWPGDWHHLNPKARPGGWSFQHCNRWYPDLDSTAIVLRGLSRLDRQYLENLQETVRRGVDWAINMQNRDGGWGVWDKDPWDLRRLPAYYLPHWDVSDTSAVDVSSRMVFALASLGCQGSGKAIRRAVEFIRRQQKEPGYWWGRWYVNYTYATSEALSGLAMAGEDLSQSHVRAAVEWLLSVQNPDGGWGESPLSYQDERYAGIGPSTASQTAYVLIGLIGMMKTGSQAIDRGIRFLLDTQQPDGSWIEHTFLGTIMPAAWYARYDLLCVYKPAYALFSHLRIKQRTGSINAAGPR